jgi:hypothetical protein
MAELDQRQLDDIERLLRQIADNTAEGPQYRGPISDMSQSAGRDRLRSNSNDNTFNFNPRRSSARRDNRYNARKPLDQFEEGLTKGLLDAVADGDFESNMKKALNGFAGKFGTTVDNFAGDLGKEMSKQIMTSPLGTAVTDSLKRALLGKNGNGGGLLSKLGGKELGGAFQEFGQTLLGGSAEVASGAAEMASATTTAAAGAAEMGGAGVAAAGGMAGLAAAIITVLPAVVAIAAVLTVVGPALEGLADVAGALGKSALRSDDERAKRTEAAQKRLEADMNYMVQRPFEILTEAANKWYEAWDNNLKDISLTQGYNKESVYNLYSSYAERLREEGLNSVIASTDIISNLDQVLKSGLSGKVAEEFAYVATKLNNAIPNQAFFGYAASYAQIAANAVAQGSSQEQALALANQQLEQFASNLLYSSRELAGGFSTGLQNASQLFTDAVNIAQTARTGNANAISGTLTSVSAILGAVAPDLANGLVQNIVNAAIGGNNDSIVALRSLAGINAGNTEFLRAFAEDPQAIFGNIFTKLADLQTMSNDNFMEVAEGLAPIFGVDMAALARVDFNYLAQAVSQMNLNSNSLEQNLELLAEGQSTTTAEQAKMQEINEMILNDGLAVVLDNDAARTIQEHMWQEQQTNALTSATYAVEIQGSMLSLIEGISQTVTNIIRFINPIGALTEMASNIATSVAESSEQQEAINQILQQGAIKSNSAVLANLTNYSGTSPIDVFGGRFSGNVNTTLGEMLFGSGFSQSITSGAGARAFASAMDWAGRQTPFGRLGAYSGDVDGAISAIANYINGGTSGGTSSNAITSRYTWNLIGKSAARRISRSSRTGTTYTDNVISAALQSNAEREAQAFADSIKESIAQTNRAVFDEATNRWNINPISYEQWREEFAAGRNLEDAFAQYGINEAEIRGMFQEQQSITQSQVTEQRAQAESDFYADGRKYMEESRAFWRFPGATYYDQYWHTFFDDGMKFDTRMDSILAEMANIRDNYIGIPDKADTVRGLLNTINSTVISFNESFTDWVQQWTDYYINHTTYTARTTSADWAELEYMEQSASRDTALALANALEGISNIEDLKDPTVQSNVLLAKIVVILEAMMQQNNSTGGLSLIDSLSAMSLGITNRT